MKLERIEKLKGFTLVEVLLYISLVSIVLLSFIGLINTITESQNKNIAISEVNQNAALFIDYLNTNIRNANSISTPTLAQTSPSLNFSNNNFSNIIIQLVSGQITITEDVNPSISLTSNKLNISNLVFKNLSFNSQTEIVKYQFDVSYKNPENRSDFNYSKTFYGTAKIRK